MTYYDSDEMFSPDQFEYNQDGDRVDKRNRVIKKLQLELLHYQLSESSGERLREEHPGLKDAWDKYQTILKLVETE